MPPMARNTAADSATRVADHDFPETHRLSTASSDDESTLMDPPPAYGPFQQTRIGGVGSKFGAATMLLIGAEP